MLAFTPGDGWTPSSPRRFRWATVPNTPSACSICRCYSSGLPSGAAQRGQPRRVPQSDELHRVARRGLGFFLHKAPQTPTPFIASRRAEDVRHDRAPVGGGELCRIMRPVRDPTPFRPFPSALQSPLASRGNDLALGPARILVPLHMRPASYDRRGRLLHPSYDDWFMDLSPPLELTCRGASVTHPNLVPRHHRA